jgi:hypothetical protein
MFRLGATENLNDDSRRQRAGQRAQEFAAGHVVRIVMMFIASLGWIVGGLCHGLSWYGVVGVNSSARSYQ